MPLPPGTGDEGWLRAMREIRRKVADFSPDAMVVSLGVDAAAADPESPLAVTIDGFREAGRLLAELAPCVAVQEGGYDLTAIGDLVCAVLEGLG
jgi:acetoin utilization deacetylase AcuC-like enzyme